MEFDYWTFFGFFAQFIFFLRFFLQWLSSEKEKKSVIPLSFWYLSVIGSILILIYSIKRRDPVFIAGLGLALFIYVRNIVMRKKEEL
jgi:lipid-A-disaccharide synthase-like uncharacterized protein